MKKYLIITLCLLLLAIPLASCSSISNLIPKQVAADTQTVVNQEKADSQDVFAEIQHNIDLVNNLKSKLEQAKIDGKVMTVNDVIKDIKTVSDSYSKLSSQHDAIRKGLLEKIQTVEDMQKDVDNQINLLKQRRAGYVTQLNQVKDPNPDIVRTRQETLTQAIKYVDSQILLWQNFNAVEANIIAQMGEISSTIDSFLSVIDSSAILYKEALNLLTLQKNITDALSIFTQDLPQMQQLTKDMEQSWVTLDYLVNSLTSIANYNTK